MCGFSGFIDTKHQIKNHQLALEQMAKQLHHRGPDDAGVWFDEQLGAGLSHARLSIQDLSHEGHQPMISQSSRYVVAYNGEVYNFNALRKDLSQYSFHSHSDTEVILAAIEVWGLKAALKKFVGMFAFALWDKKKKTMSLVRDRLGIKPLYYGYLTSGLFGFASELKAFDVIDQFEKTIDKGALARMLKYGYISAPYCIFERMSKVLPGEIVTVTIGQNDELKIVKEQFWSVNSAFIEAQANKFEGTRDEAVEQLDQISRVAIKDRMIADVPLGAFLSGGVDSSAVVALMQAQSSKPIKTFSIGFNEDQYNEAEHAKAVAKHLGTEHTELYVSPNDALSVIPSLPTMYDEPFADSSQVPTYLVSKLAREKVAVSLSGDGGDELFAGYNRYLLAESIWDKLSRVPRSLRSGVGRSLQAVPPSVYDKVFAGIRPLLPKRFDLRLPGEKIRKFAAVMGAESPKHLYDKLLCQASGNEVLVNGIEPSVLALEGFDDSSDFVQAMMLHDLQGYMPNDILTKVDRASMAVSLEARVPLLDHRLVEFAMGLPMNYKIHRGQSKWVLREMLYRYVPKKLIERPKMGFGVPIDRWLRVELKDWAEDLLDESHLKQQGLLNADFIRQRWVEHLSGKRNWQHFLWNVLMFLAWINGS